MRVEVDGQPFEVPDDATPEEIDSSTKPVAPRSTALRAVDVLADALPVTGALTGGALATPAAVAGALPSFGASSLLIPGAGAAGYSGGEFLKRKLNELTGRPGAVPPANVASSAATGANEAMTGFVGGEATKFGLAAAKRIASVAPELAEALFPKTAKAIDILRRGPSATPELAGMASPKAGKLLDILRRSPTPAETPSASVGDVVPAKAPTVVGPQAPQMAGESFGTGPSRLQRGATRAQLAYRAKFSTPSAPASSGSVSDADREALLQKWRDLKSNGDRLRALLESIRTQPMQSGGTP